MTVINLIWKYFRKVKFFFFISFVLYILSFSTSRINALLSARLVGLMSEFNADNIPLDKWFLLLFAFFMTIVAGSFLLYLAHLADAKYMPKMIAMFEKDIFMQIHKHSLRFFSEEKSGNIGKMQNSILLGILDLQRIGVGFCMNLVTIFLSIAIIAFMNLYLALFFLAVTLFFGWMTGQTRKRIITNSQKVTESESEVSGIYFDGLNNASSVKAFGNIKFERRYLFSKMKKYLRLDKQEKFYRAKATYKNNFIYDVMALSFYGATFVCWKYSGLSLADVVFIIISVGALTTSTKSFSYSISGIFRTYGQLKAGIEFIFRPHEVVDLPQAKKLKVKNPEIKFEKINFSYPNKPRLFNDFSLTVKAGEKIGLVGKSGSGKSTLVKLLARYYDVQNGKITIDGQDVSQVTQDSLRKNLAFIPQNTLLFNRTIMENIRYGNIKATDKEVMAAAKEAYCDIFIKELPQGYQTIVGDKGVLLSGGERQRIAIARAILSPAKILILDEATSALDSESEVFIQKSLEKLMAEKTVIAIAHRLSTLKNMDKIIVMQNGKITEEGTQADLLKQKGAFYNFYKLQSEGFLNLSDD